MIFAIFWENPAVVGLILALPATLLGYLGYRRSIGVDRSTSQTTSIGQAVDGLNAVIAALQADNKVLREDIIALRQVRNRVIEIEKANGPDLSSSP